MNFSPLVRYFPLVKSFIESTPAISGVYVIQAKILGLWKPIYVGKSINLSQRLKEHLQLNEPNIKLRNFMQNFQCRFTWISANLIEYTEVENELIRKLSPICNQIKPLGHLIRPLDKPNPLKSLLNIQRR